MQLPWRECGGGCVGRDTNSATRMSCNAEQAGRRTFAAGHANRGLEENQALTRAFSSLKRRIVPDTFFAREGRFFRPFSSVTSFCQQEKLTRSPKADGSPASSRPARGGTCTPQVSESEPITFSGATRKVDADPVPEPLFFR